MKTLLTCLFIGVIFISGCVQPNQKEPQTLDTQPITLFNSYEFQLPVGFSSEDEHNWLYQYEKKLGRLYLAQVENPYGDIVSILNDFQNEMFEGNLSDYELLQTDSVKTAEKEGLIRNYRKNVNKNKQNPYAVYTYHSIGILKYQNNLFKVRSLSLGFNLNPTINKVFFKIQKSGEPSLPKQSPNNQTQIDLKNMSVFSSHLIAAPKKYYFEGENTKESLQLRYKNPNNNITYYLASNQLPLNTDIGYYLDSYKANQINGGFSTSEIKFQGMQALLGKMQMQTAYIYQLHFVNNGKGQTIQMLAGKPSDKEFEKYMDEIKIMK